MNVGFLTWSLSRLAGGVFDAARRLALEVAALNEGRTYVFGLMDRLTQADLKAWDELETSTVEVRGPRSFGYAPQLLPVLERARLDILHEHGLWMYPSLACRRWSARSRKPYLISPHGMLDPWALRHSAWKKRLAAWLYERTNLNRAACIHALCEAEYRAIRRFGLSNPVCIIPNGVDLPAHQPVGPPPWNIEIPRGSKVLLFLARLHSKKGLPLLLRAWAQVQREAETNGWRLVIAGWDQEGHQAEMIRLAQELGLTHMVHFAGPQFGEAKAASLGAASAFVLPSVSEGLPVAVLEAWAYALPVVMTPACNLSEGFAAGAAICVEPDPNSIAQGLSQLFRMRDVERCAMGERGRQLVQDRFSWPKIAAEMKQVYEWVLGNATRPESVVLT